MNYFTYLSDADLLTRIRIEATNEREAGLNVIRYLREVSRRRLHVEQGYSSLHAFCTEYLKYSNGSTWRRIQAMRALEDLPELETQIAKGEQNLANVSAVQNFCKQQDKTIEEKRDLLNQISDLSKREVERKLAELAPQIPKPEIARPLNSEQTELRITLDKTTVKMLDDIRDWISHSIPNASYGQIIDHIAKIAAKKLDPAAGKRALKSATGSVSPKCRAKPGADHDTVAKNTVKNAASDQLNETTPAPRDIQPKNQEIPSTQKSPTQAMPVQTHILPSQSPRRGKIPVAIRRAVYQKDKGRCTYTHPETGRLCGSSNRLQIDHRIPVAKGGSDDLNNLRLMCRAHNLYVAVQEFGPEKMSFYLDAV